MTSYYRRGEVVLVPIEYTDKSGVKNRPVLVISPDRLNSKREDVIVLAITSSFSNPPRRDEFIIQGKDIQNCGLLKDSAIKLAKITTVSQKSIIHRLGTLPENRLTQVLRAIRIDILSI